MILTYLLGLSTLVLSILYWRERNTRLVCFHCLSVAPNITDADRLIIKDALGKLSFINDQAK